MSEIALLIYHVVITLIAIAAGAWLAVWAFSGYFPQAKVHGPRSIRAVPYLWAMIFGWLALFGIVWLIK